MYFVKLFWYGSFYILCAGIYMCKCGCGEKKRKMTHFCVSIFIFGKTLYRPLHVNISDIFVFMMLRTIVMFI